MLLFTVLPHHLIDRSSRIAFCCTPQGVTSCGTVFLEVFSPFLSSPLTSETSPSIMLSLVSKLIVHKSYVKNHINSTHLGFVGQVFIYHTTAEQLVCGSLWTCMQRQVTYSILILDFWERSKTIRSAMLHLCLVNWPDMCLAEYTRILGFTQLPFSFTFIKYN